MLQGVMERHMKAWMSAALVVGVLGCGAKRPVASAGAGGAGDAVGAGDGNVTVAVAAAPMAVGPGVVATLLPTWAWQTGGGGTGTYRVSLDGPGAPATEVVGTTYVAPLLLRAGPHTLYVREVNTAGAPGETLVMDVSIVATDPALDTATAAACNIQAGELRCFGQVSDGHGHLSPLTSPLATDANTAPVVVPNATAIAVRLSHDSTSPQACVLLDTGAVSCWGAGEPNQLTAGGLDPNLVGGVVDLTTSQYETTLQMADGSLRLYEHGTSATLVGSYNLPNGGRPLSLSGGATMCTLADTTEVWCWQGFAASQASGLSGIGTLAQLDTATAVSLGDDTPVLMVSAAGTHVCGIMGDNSLRCTDNTTVTTVDLPNGHWPAAFSLSADAGVVLLDDDSVGTFQFDGRFAAAPAVIGAGHHGVSIGAMRSGGFCVRQDDGVVFCPGAPAP